MFAAVAASGAMIGGGHAFDRFSLVPVVMHLDRTKRVASRYRTVTYAQKETGFFEAQLMRDSNGSIRELLLSNGHLLPEQLRRPAHLRVEHYDVWLRRFDAKVAREGPNPKSTFDVGFAEVKFPADAAQEFNTWYEALRGVVRRGRSADRCRVTPRDDV